MITEEVRYLAQIIAEDQISSTYYLDVYELAEEEDLTLSEDELREAYTLSLRATVVLPND